MLFRSGCTNAGCTAKKGSKYWIVDSEARHIERWRPGATNAEIVTQALAWQPVASLPALTIELDELFHVVWTGLESGPR